MTSETKSPKKVDVQKLQRAIVDGLEDVKGQEIVVFNTEHLSPLFERVIISSGTSNRQTKALASSVVDAVREAGFPKPRVEGQENGEWIIVDCGAAVAHVMQPTIRSYYHLEEIWGGKTVHLKHGAEVKKTEAPSKAAPTKTVATKTPASKAAASKAAPAKAGKPAARKTATVVETPVAKAPARKRAAASVTPPAPATKKATPTAKKTVSATSSSKLVGKVSDKAPTVVAKAPARKTAKVTTMVVGKPAAKKAAPASGAAAKRPGARKAPGRKTAG